MNKKRLKLLKSVISVLESANEILEEVKNEEQGAYENMPESFQGTEKGEFMEETIGLLDEYIESLNEMVYGIDNRFDN